VDETAPPALRDLIPRTPLREGGVALRGMTPADLAFARELATDPYVPLIGTLPAGASDEQASEWIDRQRGDQMVQRQGLTFAIADAHTDRAVGHIALWLAELRHGRASAGYSIAPSARRRGLAAAALTALTRFAWTIDGLHRIELHVEPWNVGSVRTAERAGYEREGLLRSHQEIGGERRDMLLYAAIRPDHDGPGTGARAGGP
jgi:ribosomal-protein-alanine N-acetyltransferase